MSARKGKIEENRLRQGKQGPFKQKVAREAKVEFSVLFASFACVLKGRALIRQTA